MAGLSQPAWLPNWLVHWRRDWPGIAASAAVHLIALVAMALVTIAGGSRDAGMSVESLFTDEDRTADQFTQDLNRSTEVAHEMNFVAGSAGAGGSPDALGGGGGGGAAGGLGGGGQGKIEHSGTLQEPFILVGAGDGDMPGLDSLGSELGERQVAGEVGAVVEGYGPALDRITQELMRHMRESKVLAVWLFDESESMKDDQADLRARFHKVYEELKLFDDESREDILLTAIVSFGRDVHFQLPKKRPTDDIPAIMKAIDQIPIDKTGIENTCQAISAALGEYRRFSSQGKRKVVLIVVSDESGDDGEKVEEALHMARNVHAPIYFLGREAVFGSLYGHVRWIHPQTGGLHYLPIRRGPETPFAELLQIDGFRRRYDAAMSGFGPYEQSRLARDSGGIFFMLPNEEQDINDFDARKYAALDLKEYVPDIASRREYAAERDKSPLRKAVWEAIVLLNPYDPKNKDLDIPVENQWYSVTPAEAAPQTAAVLSRCLRLFHQLTEAEAKLKGVSEQRGRERSRRWRADYDLILGQVMAYRVRLFQYILALEHFARNLPTHKFSNPQSNAWTIGIGTGEMLKPDEAQLRATRVTADDLEAARQAAQRQFAKVQREHPGTPWATRAVWEASRGYGMAFIEHYFPPPPPNVPVSTTPIAPPPNL